MGKPPVTGEHFPALGSLFTVILSGVHLHSEKVLATTCHVQLAGFYALSAVGHDFGALLWIISGFISKGLFVSSSECFLALLLFYYVMFK